MKRGSAQYKKWRESVLIRDEYTCQHCGFKPHILDIGIVAHHILNYKTYPLYRYDLNNGLTLCHKCHRRQHPTCMGSKFILYKKVIEFKNGKCGVDVPLHWAGRKILVYKVGKYGLTLPTKDECIMIDCGDSYLEGVE